MAVSFRTRLLSSFALAIALAVAVVSMLVWANTRVTLQREMDQRTAALVAEFQREFARRGEEIAAQLSAVAATEQAQRMAVDAGRPAADLSGYVRSAAAMAAEQQLDFLEFLGADGTIISSAQAPARFGYKDTTFSAPGNLQAAAFLNVEQSAQSPALALEAIRPVRMGSAVAGVYVIGGVRVGRDFLASLVLPAGMRAVLYRDAGDAGTAIASADLISGSGNIAQPGALQPLIDAVRQRNSEQVLTVNWGDDTGRAETFYAMPLFGPEHQRVAVLLVGSSRQAIVRLQRRIGWIALAVAVLGVMIGLAFATALAVQVTRPIDQLSRAAREVASGRLDTQVTIGARDEIGHLAESFNQMTRELAESRDRLVQAERVAAWRELARRLAHELKNPLFPIQLTVESLARARQQKVENFDEILRESTAALATELANLKAIIARFSDFARMPAPQLQSLDVNDAVTRAARLFEAQLTAPQRPPIKLELRLDPGLRRVRADADLLHRALSNLILNALDAMPQGGTLTLKTAQQDGHVRLEVSDSGAGISEEEAGRLFTPYYTTKQHGTGLGLAFVQSVVSDHGGKVSVISRQGQGATFVILLPEGRTEPLPEGRAAALNEGRDKPSREGGDTPRDI